MALSPLSLTGFTKSTNLVLFLLLPCTFALFSLSNLPALARGNWVYWHVPRAPGEKIWFQDGTIRMIAMQVHMWSVIPAGIMLPLQFLPIMRKKFLYAHKLTGRLLFSLLMVANITALTVGNRSFGGTLDTQAYVVILAISSTVSVFKAWTSIRELKIDVHRRWVLRTWGFVCSILSLRLAMVILIITIGIFFPTRFRMPLSCQELAFLYRSDADGLLALAARYPMCGAGDLATGGAWSADVFVAVAANFSGGLENKTALSNLVFGTSGVLGFVVNAVGVEVYLERTREEDERLRKVSGVRRRAAGLEKKVQ